MVFGLFFFPGFGDIYEVFFKPIFGLQGRFEAR